MSGSSLGYLSALERERDELERECRKMRALFGLAAGYGVGLSLVIAVVWVLVMFGIGFGP